MEKGLLSEFSLVGVYSRTKASADRLCQQARSIAQNAPCICCDSIDQLLSLKPDYIVEAASPAALKEFIIPALKQGTSVVTLSIGALADKPLYQQVQEVAKESGASVHIVSGAIGGLDVLNTLALMGASEATFDSDKGAKALRTSPVYEPSLENEEKIVFSGSATEAIELFPTRVNVAVAASLASVGPDNMRVSMKSIPDYVGDEHKIRIKGDGVEAKIDVYSSNADIAAWSVVATLRNIVSPIKFG